jgi:hypothetical protein
MRWTPEMDARLCEMHGSATAQEAADALGVTREQVWYRSERLGLGTWRSRWEQADLDTLHATYPLLGQDCAPLCHHTRQQTARRAMSCRLHRVWKHRPKPDAERRKYALMALRWCAEHGMRGHDALAWCADVCGCAPQMMALVLPALARDEMKSRKRRKRK